MAFQSTCCAFDTVSVDRIAISVGCSEFEEQEKTRV